jgi:SAM-dependent methyltransferase
MSARPADGGGFACVEQDPDPAALIAMLDLFEPPLRVPRAALLDQLALAEARTALDIGCGTGGGTAEMARRMPRDSTAAGVDASEAMIAEARRRAAGQGVGLTFRVGDAQRLPYPDGSFGACRAQAVLQHLADPARAVREMARVTRPGCRVGVLEYDLGTLLVDHPDRPVTTAVLGALCDSMAQPWIGRQVLRLFRMAGLADVLAEPLAVLGSYEVFRALLGPAVTRLCDERALTAGQADEWWSWLGRQHEAGAFLGGVTVFAVTGTRPGTRPLARSRNHPPHR